MPSVGDANFQSNLLGRNHAALNALVYGHVSHAFLTTEGMLSSIQGHSLCRANLLINTLRHSLRNRLAVARGHNSPNVRKQVVSSRTCPATLNRHLLLLPADILTVLLKVQLFQLALRR